MTAISGSDFLPISQILFDPSETEGCAYVTIINDGTEEGDETLTLTIIPGQEDLVVGLTNVLTVTILDDGDGMYS